MNQPQTKSWWSRNWIWVVPAGCLTPILICGGIITFVFVFGAIKSSDIYKDAVAQAKVHEQVKALIGEPIEPTFFTMGNLQVSDDTGTADLIITLTGPKGAAVVHAVATKAGGKWEYSKLEVMPSAGGQQPIDLLAKPEDNAPDDQPGDGNPAESKPADEQ